jgi:integrase
MPYVIKRGKWYHFKRRVPNLYRHFYDDEFVQTSLKTDSETIAHRRAQIFNAELEKLWHHVAMHGPSEQDVLFQRAVIIARLGGFSYQPAADIAKADLGHIVSRVEAVKEDIDRNPEAVKAVLGGHDKPLLPISQALEDYFAFELPNHHNKSDDQIRKWKNPRRKAINNFIRVCGDKEVNTITRDDILTFREWWHDRIRTENLTANSSNKDFSYLSQVLAYVRDDKRIDIDVSTLLARMRFTETASSRPPFKAEYIKNTLLDPENLKGLNDECRFFLFAMADTGARPSELVGLNSENGDIRLDTDIPYIYIRPDAKKALKTPHSKRQIPLVGASLYAFRNLPQGFDHYYRKSDLLSATINKFLREHELLPTGQHCIYSLRHSFEDRLTAVEPPDKVQAALMGHKYDRPRYGDGPSLEQKQKWLNKICLDIRC